MPFDGSSDSCGLLVAQPPKRVTFNHQGASPMNGGFPRNSSEGALNSGPFNRFLTNFNMVTHDALPVLNCPPFNFSFEATSGNQQKHLQPIHGCCWETFYIVAYCGLVVEIPTLLLKSKLLLPFQRQPSHVRTLPLRARQKSSD